MRRPTCRLVLVALACTALGGCPSSSTDAGAPVDGGARDDGGPPRDSGAEGDAGVPVDDAGDHGDAGEADAGPVEDSGVVDGGLDDAGPTDAGAADAGLVDGGPLDAGSSDGGSSTPPDGGVVDGGGDMPSPSAVAYFSSIDGALTDAALVDVLHARLSSTHVVIPYDDLPEAYVITDGDRGGCAGIFDFYSSNCWQAADACGQYSAEGDCFNREHSWPKSWWGGSTSIAAHSDLVAVVPTDGYVNNQRGNLALGEVASATYTSTNGSKKGSCVQLDAGAECFEPTDALKGDFARIYFYMAVRYEGELACCDVAQATGADLDPWSEGVLRAWHVADPVDEDERARNEAVFTLQGNRNPFVDYPSWVARVGDY